MTHLTPEQMLDLAEGTQPESAAPHLQACATCYQQVAELRAMLTATNEVPLPEPSPLFWDRLSARVRESVAAEEAARTGPRWVTAPWRLVWPVAATGALVLAVVFAVGRVWAPSADPTTGGSHEQASSSDGDSVGEVLARVFPEDDPSFRLVVDLAAGLDWDDAVEAGFATRPVTLERAALALDQDERLELQRLLQEELSRSGA